MRHHSLLLAAVGLASVLGVIAWIAVGNGAELSQDNEQLVAWRTDLAAARSESKSTGKPVLMDFTAIWCAPCQTMNKTVWSDAAVAEEVNERYVPLLIDIDSDAGRTAAQRYGVATIPTIIATNEEGEVLAVGSFMDAAQMIEFLRNVGGDAMPATASSIAYW